MNPWIFLYKMAIWSMNSEEKNRDFIQKKKYNYLGFPESYTKKKKIVKLNFINFISYS